MIDSHYANLVSARLDKFKQVRNGVYTFRCPYCGDSQKYKNKTRGYFFTKKSGLVFKCHNCGVGRSFGNFLKEQASDVYDEYVMERYKSGLTGKYTNTASPKTFVRPRPTFPRKNNIEGLQRCDSLNKKHPAYEYLLSRQLDPSLFYYTDEFCTWANTQKYTFTDIKKDHPRIIIPFIDVNKKWFGFQGRSLIPNDRMRYITIMLDENSKKIYGLDKIDYNKTVYIVEGPFDATFLGNSIAMAGSDVDIRKDYWSDHIWVYDNEPRNREIVNKLNRRIDDGDKVVIWPTNIKQKDINDMVLAGHDVQSLVELNSYQGLEAKVKFTEWKKV